MLCTGVRKNPFSLGGSHHRMGIEGLPSLQLREAAPYPGVTAQSKPPAVPAPSCTGFSS